jgi:REP element-mobilizing transposase RayT
VFRRLAEQKPSRIEERHLMSDHVHMLISIPQNFALSEVVGYIKGKSAIYLTRMFGKRKQNFVGQYFLTRDYDVETVDTVGAESAQSTMTSVNDLNTCCEAQLNSRGLKCQGRVRG